jgi:hypothetical protein
MPKKKLPQLEELMRESIDANSLHDVLHAIIEVCYAKSLLTRGDTTSDRWRMLARELTSLEDHALRLSL